MKRKSTHGAQKEVVKYKKGKDNQPIAYSKSISQNKNEPKQEFNRFKYSIDDEPNEEMLSSSNMIRKLNTVNNINNINKNDDLINNNIDKELNSSQKSTQINDNSYPDTNKENVKNKILNLKINETKSDKDRKKNDEMFSHISNEIKPIIKDNNKKRDTSNNSVISNRSNLSNNNTIKSGKTNQSNKVKKGNTKVSIDKVLNKYKGIQTRSVKIDSREQTELTNLSLPKYQNLRKLSRNNTSNASPINSINENHIEVEVESIIIKSRSNKTKEKAKKEKAKLKLKSKSKGRVNNTKSKSKANDNMSKSKANMKKDKKDKVVLRKKVDSGNNSEAHNDEDNEDNDEEYNTKTKTKSKNNTKKSVKPINKDEDIEMRDINHNQSPRINPRLNSIQNPIKSKNTQALKLNNKSKDKKNIIEVEDANLISEDLYILPCRETEQNIIYNFIKDGLCTQGAYFGLYISGMPGTGKTESIIQTIKKLRLEVEHKIIPNFNYIYINGMRMSNANVLYKQFFNSIFSSKKECSYQKSCQMLEDFFKDRNNADPDDLKDKLNSHIVVVVDEIDMLVNKKQNHLYNIFNWTSYPNSKLIVISISNTLDLPDRLNQKVKSRSGNNRLVFKPYKYEQLITIFKSKIKDIEYFQEDALNICCKKVAALNGDLRRILQLCKKSVEIFKKRKDLKMIDSRIVLDAWNKLFDSKVVHVLSEVKMFEKLILVALLYELKQSQSNKCEVIKVFDRIKFFGDKLNKDFGSNELSYDEFKLIVFNLVKLNVLEYSESNENFLKSSICVKFYPDEFCNAMIKDEEWSKIAEDYIRADEP